MKLSVRLTKQQVIKTTSLSVVTALALGIVSPLAAAATPRRLTNQDKSVTNAEVRQALQNTTGVLDASDQTKATADSTDALKAASAGATVQVPKDAKKGISITAKDNSSSLNVALPNAASAGPAQTVANGIVSYPSTTQGFANAVQANEDGSVRMLTIIDNPNAPTRYDYRITVPSGGSIKLTNDGGVAVLAQDGKPVAVVDRPWAKDANGKSIQTWFVTNGQALTQYVKHNVAGVVYPVTADPSVRWAWYGVTIYFNRQEVAAARISLGAATAYALRSPLGTAAAFVLYEIANEATGGKCAAIYKSFWTLKFSAWTYRC